jgi:hypothetical protein
LLETFFDIFSEELVIYANLTPQIKGVLEENDNDFLITRHCTRHPNFEDEKRNIMGCMGRVEHKGVF